MLAVDREDAAVAAPLRGKRKLAGRDEALLVREREVDAALERPEGRGNPREADDGVEDDVGPRPLEELGEIPPTWVSGATPSTGRDLDAAATSSSPRFASMISRACRPIDPVAPRSATRLIRSV